MPGHIGLPVALAGGGLAGRPLCQLARFSVLSDLNSSQFLVRLCSGADLRGRCEAGLQARETVGAEGCKWGADRLSRMSEKLPEETSLAGWALGSFSPLLWSLSR